jgi:hypothetical protein
MTTIEERIKAALGGIVCHRVALECTRAVMSVIDQAPKGEAIGYLTTSREGIRPAANSVSGAIHRTITEARAEFGPGWPIYAIVPVAGGAVNR